LLKKLFSPAKNEGNDSKTTPTTATAETTTAATAEKNKTSSSQDEKIVSQFEGWWNTKATTMFDGSFRFWLKSLN